jgi:hypothetical protein
VKKFGWCVALLMLAIWNSGLAQVAPEAQALLDKAVQSHGGRTAIERMES